MHVYRAIELVCFIRLSDKMDRWMDGCVGGWTDGWIDGWLDGWMDGLMDGQMDRWMDGWIDGQMESWLAGWLVGWLAQGSQFVLVIKFQVISRFYPGPKSHSPGYIVDNFGTKRVF